MRERLELIPFWHFELAREKPTQVSRMAGSN